MHASVRFLFLNFCLTLLLCLAPAALAAVTPDPLLPRALLFGNPARTAPQLSPDGTRLAFVSNRDGQYEVYVAAADGRQPVNLTRHPGLDSFPTWTRDGRGVTFVSNRDGACELYTQGIAP